MNEGNQVNDILRGHP